MRFVLFKKQKMVLHSAFTNNKTPKTYQQISGFKRNDRLFYNIICLSDSNKPISSWWIKAIQKWIPLYFSFFPKLFVIYEQTGECKYAAVYTCLLAELFTILFMHTSLIRESPGVDRNHFSQLFVEVMDTQNCEAELFGRLCEKTLSRSLPEWVQEEGLPGGCDSQCLQQQTLADIWALAALQWEHVLLRGGKGDLRSQAHELPWTLVRLLFPHNQSCCQV